MILYRPEFVFVYGRKSRFEEQFFPVETSMIGDLNVRVVSNAEAEQVDCVVCILADMPTPFTDNEVGVCHDCGKAIQFRPYVPKTPIKLCVGCATKHMENPDERT